jgi:hypothetical protein
MMNMYTEDDLIPLSALQHLLFCERQCALIYIEQAWAENGRTRSLPPAGRRRCCMQSGAKADGKLKE